MLDGRGAPGGLAPAPTHGQFCMPAHDAMSTQKIGAHQAKTAGALSSAPEAASPR